MTTVLTSNEPSKFSTQPTSQGPFPCEAEQHMHVAVRLMRRARGGSEGNRQPLQEHLDRRHLNSHLLFALTDPTMSTQEDNNQEIILL